MWRQLQGKMSSDNFFMRQVNKIFHSRTAPVHVPRNTPVNGVGVTSPSVVVNDNDDFARELGAADGYTSISSTQRFQTMEGVGGSITWYGKTDLFNVSATHALLFRVVGPLKILVCPLMKTFPDILPLSFMFFSGMEIGCLTIREKKIFSTTSSMTCSLACSDCETHTIKALTLGDRRGRRQPSYWKKRAS